MILKQNIAGLLLVTCLIGLLLFLSIEPVQAQANPSAAMLTTALSLPLCDGLALTSPADNPAFVDFNAAVYYGWQGEPAGVIRREVVVYNVAQGGGLLDLTPFAAYEAGWTWQGALAAFVAAPGGAWINLQAFNGLPGTYLWLAVFYGPEGAPLCRSGHHWLDVRTATDASIDDSGNNGSGSDGGGNGGSAQPAGQHAPPQQPTDPCAGRPMIIVLFGSPYGGERDLDVYTNDFTGSECGETIHGNDNENRINGMGGNDTIFGYSGNDMLVGGLGSDTIYGGDGDDQLYGGSWNIATTSAVNGGTDGDDALYGEAGDDGLTGGNVAICLENDCQSYGGVSGNDQLDGGMGNDTLIGGNLVYCEGDNCRADGGVDDNDRLEGGAGDDYLYGGNYVLCQDALLSPGLPCVALGGTDGDDVIVDSASGSWGGIAVGGNFPACTTDNCAAFGGIDGSDIITTSDGNDTIIGGNSALAWANNNLTANAGTDGADTLNGGGGNDILVGGGVAECMGISACNLDAGTDGADTLNSGPGVDTLDGNNVVSDCSSGTCMDIPIDDGAADTLDCGLDTDADTTDLMPGDTVTNCP